MLESNIRTSLPPGRDSRSRHECGESDFIKFIRAWAKSPLRVAAIAPSSRSLARLITSEISAGEGPVLELGPGTGVFTRALLARGLSQTQLTLIEYGEEFIASLKERFPDATVLHADAAYLGRRRIFESADVAAVVSGLPLLSMSPRKVASILKGTFSYMRPGAAFFQFTYGPTCPVPVAILDMLGLEAKRVGFTLRNIPPASVYRISRWADRKP